MAPSDGLRNIDELPLASRRVLVRVDFDVPLDESGGVASDRKLRAALPTIQKALQEGARVVLLTHLGEAGAPAVSLEPVAARLAELLGQDVYLPDECIGDAARKVVSDLREGQLCMLENLRFLPEEASNDETLARKLLSLGDVYVAESFGAAHLVQASTVALPRIMKERGIGYRFKAELDGLSRATSDLARPFIGLLGGSNFSRSLPVLEAMLRRCDAVLVGGVVGNTLLAAKGVDLKASAVEQSQLALGRALLSRARDQKVELVLPSDLMIGKSLRASEAHAVSAGSVPDGSAAFDIGPKTLELFRSRIQSAKTVLFHGPLGALEGAEFSAGTHAALLALSESPAFGIVTGESLSSAALALGGDIEQQIGLISTGGMASLVFIEGKQLPGLNALRG